MKDKKKPVTIELRFDTEEDAKCFVAAWLDGGGEQTCGFLTPWEESDDWTKGRPKWLKLVWTEEDEV